MPEPEPEPHPVSWYRLQGEFCAGTMMDALKLARKPPNRMTSAQALVLALLWLRGGVATCCQAQADSHEWAQAHGSPSWRKLLAWARGVEVEAGIAGALVRLRGFQPEGQA